MMKQYQIPVEAIEQALARGERVELIPGKDGVKVVRVRREEMKTEKYGGIPKR